MIKKVVVFVVCCVFLILGTGCKTDVDEMQNYMFSISVYGSCEPIDLNCYVMRDVVEKVKDFIVVADGNFNEDDISVIVKTLLLGKYKMDVDFSIKEENNSVEIMLEKGKKLLIKEEFMIPINRIGEIY